MPYFSQQVAGLHYKHVLRLQTDCSMTL